MIELWTKAPKWLKGVVYAIFIGSLPGNFITYFATQHFAFAAGEAEGEKQGIAQGMVKVEEMLPRLVKEGIERQYPDELKVATEAGYLSGKEDGLRQGQRTCAINAFWEGFNSLLVDAQKIVESRKSSDKEILDTASSVVRGASLGRESFEDMARALDGDIDDLETALMNGDMGQIRRLLDSIVKGIELRRSIWADAVSKLASAK